MTTTISACLGGWCRKRDRCVNYNAPDKRWPAERLCVPGRDGVGLDVPVRWHMPVGAWERVDMPSLFVSAQPFDNSQVTA